MMTDNNNLVAPAFHHQQYNPRQHNLSNESNFSEHLSDNGAVGSGLRVVNSPNSMVIKQESARDYIEENVSSTGRDSHHYRQYGNNNRNQNITATDSISSTRDHQQQQQLQHEEEFLEDHQVTYHYTNNLCKTEIVNSNRDNNGDSPIGFMKQEPHDDRAHCDVNGDVNEQSGDSIKTYGIPHGHQYAADADDEIMVASSDAMQHYQQQDFQSNASNNGTANSTMLPPTSIHSYSRLQNQNQQQAALSNGNASNIKESNWHQTQTQLSYSNNLQRPQYTSATDADTVAIATGMVEMHHGHGSVPEENISTHRTNAYGMLKYENEILYITEKCTEIGRNTSTSRVHFPLTISSFISRKHFKVLYDMDVREFYLLCLSKNGIFIDTLFHRRNAPPMKLPKSCFFRFPSTEIRIFFESYVNPLSSDDASYNNNNIIEHSGSDDENSTDSHQHLNDHQSYPMKPNLNSINGSKVIFSPLKISIPKTEQKSPYPSPTATISAANSRATSPRQIFQDYHSQQQLFQTPSNDHEKPPYSYAQLIVQSISAAPDKQLTLSGIYSFISKHYPYYRKEANKGWQNSIRHNLSLNRYFIKVARSQDEPGKGSFWRIDPNSEGKLINQSFKKRRQRGSQSFRPSYGMPQSAPTSPSHIDNGRENSPLNDVVLQSAPGSPGASYQNHLDNRASEHLISYDSHAPSEQNSVGLQGNGNTQQKVVLETYLSRSPDGNGAITSNGSMAAAGALIAIKRHHISNSNMVSNRTTYSNAYDDMSDQKSVIRNTTTGMDSDDDCEPMKRTKYGPV